MNTNLCSDCPPEGWPTDKTRCAECPRADPELSVMGAGGGPAPMPTEEDRKRAWRAIYMATLMKHAGLDEIAAKDCYDAGSGDYDFTDDPEQAALEEMEYWTE